MPVSFRKETARLLSYIRYLPGANTMTDRSLGSPEPEWAAFLAIHWANKKHAWTSYVADVSKREHEEITHSPEDIHVWISQLTTRFADLAIVVCVEQPRRHFAVCIGKYGNLVLYSIRLLRERCKRVDSAAGGSKRRGTTKESDTENFTNFGSSRG